VPSYSIKLTARSVTAIKPDGTRFDVKDTDVTGLHVRMGANGVGVYRLQYRRPDGSKPVITLGRITEFTADQARDWAKAQKAAIVQGADPSRQKGDWRAAPTMDDLWARYEAAPAWLAGKRGRTQEEYRRNWTNHAQPVLGALKVAEVGPKDIRKVMTAMGRSKAAANRVRALLSVMFSCAIEAEMRAGNPVTAVKKNEENGPRDVAFTDDELGRIGAALDQEPEEWAKLALLLLMATGSRKGEVLGAEWSEFHLEGDAPLWVIPKERMKGKREHIYHLGPDVVGALKHWRATAPFLSPRWVFSNTLGTGPRADLKKPWARLKASAKLSRGVIHSFRHTYLTRLAETGVSAIDIQRTAGHADIATSMLYVHAAEARRLREIQVANQANLRAAMGGRKAAEVVQLGERGRERA
jgi:integrase